MRDHRWMDLDSRLESWCADCHRVMRRDYRTVNDCPGKPASPPRDWQQTPATDSMWARLQADLNNLAPSYGPLPEPVSDSVRVTEPVDNGPQSLASLSQCDRNAYFDGLILAARKRREAEIQRERRREIVEECDREDSRTWDARQAEHDRAQMLSAACSLPISFTCRMGGRV